MSTSVSQSAFDPPKKPVPEAACCAGKMTKWVTKNSALMIIARSELVTRR